MYFPFFTQISIWTKKNPVTFDSYCIFIIDFPFVIFVTGEKDGPEFFLVTFVSSGVITLSVFSICYFRHADFYMDQEKLLLFHIVNVEKADLSLIFPSLRFRYVCNGGKDGLEFFLLTFVSSGVIILNVFSIGFFQYTDFYMDQEKPVTFFSYC